ncbi:MAG: dephospho-CoA kinase [Deltaproteobacteria bacterium]|nr:dephospho-CoA kinase [Candidatus Zymogenaceae bacterium]
MLITGLTGGIASGKSSAGKIIERLGGVIVDSDAVARHVVMPGEPALDEIVRRFGADVLDEGGVLDREKLRYIVFYDDTALKDLNAIVHPAVYREIARRMEEYRNNPNDKILFLDIPLLYESGGEALVDTVVVVYVDRKTQIDRLMARDEFSREEAENRIDKQMSLDEKRDRADFVIDNRGTLNDLEAETVRVFGELEAMRDRRRAAGGQ